jgi:hypothetical protein
VNGTGEFEVFCVRTDVDPQDSRRITYPIARVYENNKVIPVPWTSELLMDAMQRTLRCHRNAYGGQWHLRIVKAEPDAVQQDRPHGSRAEAEAIILAGPDTPGRRFLQRLRGQSQPLIPALAGQLHRVEPVEVPKVASRADLERLHQKPEYTGEPVMFDPDHDPALQGDLPGVREPGEEG